MVEAQATARGIRTSAQKAGLVCDLIRGKTEPGTTIRVAGRETIAGTDGLFQAQVTAGGNVRELILEAQDSHGNSSQYTVSLSARPRIRT